MAESTACVKRCSKCDESKPLDDFWKSGRSPSGRQSWCKSCVRVAQRDLARRKRADPEQRAVIYARDAIWRKNHPDAARRGKLRRSYNISLETYNEMLAAQNGVCTICGAVCPSGHNLAVDHDRSCCPGDKSCGKCVRELLCGTCNPMLGYAQDSVERLRSAIAYLERWHERTSGSVVAS